MMTKIRLLSALLGLSVLGLATRLAAQNYTPFTITTVSGSYLNPGLQNGAVAQAQFYRPAAIAVDSAGNVYVGDTGNNAIRKITPAGQVSTVATGFGPIYGLVADTSGNLYVSDQINTSGSTGALKKVVISTGAVTTLVSSGLAAPAGLTLDSSGNIYVADSGNYVVRKVTPGGTMTVYAGTAGQSTSKDGPAGTGALGLPTGVAFDTAGNLYVTDGAFDVVRKVNTSGSMSNYAGTVGIPSQVDGNISGSAGNAGFTTLNGIASDSSGNLYILDGDLIREISSAGVTSTLAGSFGRSGVNDGSGQNALFNNPAGIAAPAAGKVYIADTGNSEIRLGVSAANATPTIQYPPTSVSANLGGSASFMVTASGSNLSYQWNFNGSPISGATSSTLNLSGITAAQGGSYSVTVSNSSGSVTSTSATLTVVGAPPPPTPTITTQPASTSVASGGTVTLSVTASISGGSALTYQWYFNGNAISGATNATLTLTNVTSSQAGSYTVTVTSGTQSVTSAAANVVVTGQAAPPFGHLINLSVLTTMNANDNFTVGFVSGGSGTSGSEPVLVRAVGPSLSTFGLNPVLDDPFESFYNGSTLVASNDNWGGDATISAISAQVGAFALSSASSKDAALYLASAPSGNNSIIIKGDGSVGGSVLGEIYDATPTASFSATSPRLINVSVLKNMGTVLTVGFTVGGSTNRNVLIRAVGPSLATIFGLTGVASDPQLQLFNNSSGAVIQTNDNWGGTPALTSAMATSGAFTLAATSLDAAMIANLAPGTYSAQATVSSGSTGVVLVDLYELP